MDAAKAIADALLVCDALEEFALALLMESPAHGGPVLITSVQRA